MITHTILYVTDQDKSTAFYCELLKINPRLHVPGMTEFELSSQHILGLMPEKGIERLLPELKVSPAGIRAELYIRLHNAKDFFLRGIELGATLVSPMELRNWGDTAGYIMDTDSNIIAFAELV